ncbi:MAG: hypothetical protein ACXWCZ_10505, partial [Flavisolibacter sp.]
MLIGKNIVRFCVAFYLVLLPHNYICAQKADSTGNDLSQKHGSFLQFLSKVITRRNADSSIHSGGLIVRNEVQFLPYEGKVIRNILVKQFGFEKTFADTTKEIRYFGKDFVKHLHKNTRERVIRNNLFIKEKSLLNANVVADNERHLRSLNYINDARILVSTIADVPDSIDLVVITRDFFSIIVELNAVKADRFKAKVGDANFLGMGQRIQFTTLIEKGRDPHFGYEFLYRKNSIGSTFINASFGYSKIYPNLNDHTSNEHTWHAEIEKPLVSQYLHVAGAMRLAQNQSYNNYLRSDTLFYKYRYNTFDAWIGYNLGVHKFLFLKSVLNRQFISIRYFRNIFARRPFQVKNEFNFRFNDREAVLAQFTFVRQNFYKTNYFFGFGVTEDVPYGYNISLTAGRYRQMNLKRTYAGVDANRYIVTDKGNVMQYFLRAGAFLNKDKIQDAAVLLGTSSFSRIYSWKNLKMRQYMRLSYTKQFNRLGLDPLSINNVFGLPYISSDSASGNQRSSLHTETIFFLKYKLLGFKFAPFASADIAFFTPEQKKSSNSGFYFGLGGGLRTRNENILFGTIELRFMFFPRKSQEHDAFKLTILTNLRFRSNYNYVKAPDIVQVNSDFDNTI